MSPAEWALSNKIFSCRSCPRIALCSAPCCYRASSCPSTNHLKWKRKRQGVRAKLTESPLEMSGEKIVPSVTRYFTQGQTLYVFFQAYYPEKSDKAASLTQTHFAPL